MTQRHHRRNIRLATPHSDPPTLPTPRPVLAASLLTAASMAASGLVGWIATRFLPPMDASFVALGVMTGLATVFVTTLRWWRDLGLSGPQEWRHLHLFALPAVLVLIVPFLHGVKPLPLWAAVYLAVGYALTGFYEELWARGVLLRVLRPCGETRAVLVSALLFGAMHLGNVLYRDPPIVLAQAVGACCFGLAYGALRFRTNALWVLMALHAMHDFTLRFSNFPPIPLSVAQDILLLGFAGVLLRGSGRGGQPAPAASGTGTAGTVLTTPRLKRPVR
ncbi:CPBP family intramembrane metalloprotease (plasmid) [Deinococcus metallilatus]|uniref:CPBP family intramembrane metalloprotease n=1 Tax=Deinococcus metallilatus TaxID=1211322 RepID=A0AAJ5JZZ6_9DEIO|nr:CPBP family intramembrane glutamic endopeptidase [Deinococcus metallilatus]MBB5295646.1 hypothetical protein [Deinococcus metallilatus]QBY06894.1 CPBP family intramembrane metalloprotease [Deinococcus metallilatus]TLK32284.1 CPBP family intramembrane metalloprotease [Deinococcus metallilatus]GMA14175.1 hypothetical protein GCM10025871_05060 [Deinococcus metallilatus]